MKTKIKKDIQIQKINESSENYKEAYKSKNPKFSKLGTWLKKESTIFKNEKEKQKRNYKIFERGEIIKVDFGVNMGSELSDIHFAIVLNNDDKETVDNITVLPLTSKKGYKRLCLGKLKVSTDFKNFKDSFALITQITTISKNKVLLRKQRFYCNQENMNMINEKLIEYLTK